jgi:hypothetical protein
VTENVLYVTENVLYVTENVLKSVICTAFKVPKKVKNHSFFIMLQVKK